MADRSSRPEHYRPTFTARDEKAVGKDMQAFDLIRDDDVKRYMSIRDDQEAFDFLQTLRRQYRNVRESGFEVLEDMRAVRHARERNIRRWWQFWKW